MFTNKFNVVAIAGYIGMIGMSIYMCVKNVQKCKSDIAVNKRTMEVMDDLSETLKEIE